MWLQPWFFSMRVLHFGQRFVLARIQLAVSDSFWHFSNQRATSSQLAGWCACSPHLKQNQLPQPAGAQRIADARAAEHDLGAARARAPAHLAHKVDERLHAEALVLGEGRRGRERVERGGRHERRALVLGALREDDRRALVDLGAEVVAVALDAEEVAARRREHVLRPVLAKADAARRRRDRARGHAHARLRRDRSRRRPAASSAAAPCGFAPSSSSARAAAGRVGARGRGGRHLAGGRGRVVVELHLPVLDARRRERLLGVVPVLLHQLLGRPLHRLQHRLRLHARDVEQLAHLAHLRELDLLHVGRVEQPHRAVGRETCRRPRRPSACRRCRPARRCSPSGPAGASAEAKSKSRER